MRFFQAQRRLCALSSVAISLATLSGPAASGDVAGNSTVIPISQASFAVEVESALGMLQEVPVWNEIEQRLDDPYAVELDPIELDATVRSHGW